MKKTLALSIVIPVYNEEHHLKDCLDAVAAQTVAPDEVIVVDNNSTDGTADIARSYSFVTLVTEKQQGVFHARNRGFNTAKGKIIGRIDADSIIEKNWVAEALRIFENEQVAATTGPAFFYDMPLSPGNYLVDHAVKKPLYKYDKNFPFLFGTNMAIKKEAWKAIKAEVCDDKEIHEDIDLAVHLHANDLHILYDPKLRAGMSARRYDDKPKDFYRYVTMMRKTFKKHGMRPIGAHVAEAAFSMGYVVLWPLRRAYDPVSGKRTAKQLLRGHKARKNPNG